MTVDARRSSADPLLVSRRESNGRAFIRRSARIVVVVIVGGAFLQPYRRGGRRDDGFVVVGGRRPPAVDASRREGDRVDDAVVRVPDRADKLRRETTTVQHLRRSGGRVVLSSKTHGVELDCAVGCGGGEVGAVGRPGDRIDPARVAREPRCGHPLEADTFPTSGVLDATPPDDPDADGLVLRSRREHGVLASGPRDRVDPALVAAELMDDRGVVLPGGE
mmetsp:Transcript_25822/g.103150  ORF Transcript_25822/g.103150 Transcript_25822/m.103150 type:complete len:220 (-) Transcript_25822:120-779(-)